MPYSIKDYDELLEIMRSQDEVISKQNRTIERLTNKVLELENFIDVAEVGGKIQINQPIERG